MDLRQGLALVSLAVAAGAVPAAAQAPTLPPDAVAQVGAEPIAKADFDRWLRTAARGQDRGGGVPDPPEFTRCIRAERRVARGQKRRPSRRTLRRRCRARYEQLRDEVMQFLVQNRWVRQEAAARGIVVTPRQVRRSFEEQKRAAFETERGYRRFLRQSGMTEADILYRIEHDLLSSRITSQVAASAPPVTDAEIDRYYSKRKRRYRGIPRRKAKRAVRQLLQAQRQQRAIDRFLKDFRARYRAITVCAEGYVIRECSNGPAE